MTYESSTAIATFVTVDGSDTPISGAVSSSTFTFKWTTTTGLETDLTFDLDVTPACTYSAISWSPSVLPITLQIGTSSYTLVVEDFSHAYDEEWTTAGYPDACTIGATFGGSALPITTVDATGFEATIAPTDDTEIGITTLDVTLTYTAS